RPFARVHWTSPRGGSTLGSVSRIVRPSAVGPPAVLEIVDVPEPPVPADGVVVAVRAAGVNPIDWKLYSGAFHAVDAAAEEAAGVAAPLPSLGLECAGVVTAVGADADGVRIGDEVIVYPVTAAYADAVAAPVAALVPKPAGLGWPEAGGLMLAG